MREYEIKPHLQKTLRKLQKKDKAKYKAVLNKINEVINSPNPEHYKNLRYDLKDKKRVHTGSHVLIFNYDKNNDIITFLDYDHHDNIYT